MSGRRDQPPRIGLAYMTSQVGALVAQRFAEALEPRGLKPPHVAVLRMLGRHAEQTQRALSSLLGIFPSQLVGLLDDLEGRGLIARRPTANDRRAYAVALTARGVRELARVVEITAALDASFFAALEPEAKRTLASLLERVAEAQWLSWGAHPTLRQLRNTAPKEESVSLTFSTKIHQEPGRSVTGIIVPAEILEALGAGKKPAVVVTVNGYEYRSTIATMGGRSMISLSAEHRQGAGVVGGQKVEVGLALDVAPKTTVIPDDLRRALDAAGLVDRFEAAAPSKRKEWVRQVETAKAEATRARRVEKVVDELGGGR